MANVAHADKIDTGGWVPPQLIAVPPVFVWPPKPLALLKWLFGFPGYLFPWNASYVGIAFLIWIYLIPEMREMEALEFGWIARLFVINLVLITVVTSAWHLRLYVQRAQGITFKYNKRWPKENSTFLFGNQHIDNIIWTVFSGVPVVTAYLVITLWAMANGWVPHVEWANHPIYLGLIMLFTQLFRDAHFFCIHRLIHWPPLYRWVHSIHHKNANPGPWSGLAMHPVEHVLYFSSVLIHWVVPSNPLLVLYHLQAAAFGPARDHCGFSKVMIDGRARIDAASYMHYLHHRYFEVNYGDGIVPLDRCFGTWHDGSREAHEAMNQRFLKKKAQNAAMTA
jgi:sterol desaturase/sphingolipid hydroxylase (fatty acid hydroxylase superfamily)